MTRRIGLVLVAALLASGGIFGQTTTRPCVVTLNPDGSLSVACPPATTTPPPTPVNCAGTWAPVPPGTWSACVNGSQSRQEAFTVTTPPANGGTACPASPRTVTQPCTTTPPPTNNNARLTNAAAHPSSGIANGVSVNLDWTSTGSNPVTISLERPDGSTVTPGPAVSARTFPVPAVNGLWRVVYNRGTPACTATSTVTCETWRHVTITTTGGGGPVDPPIEPPPTGQIVGLPVTAEELGQCAAAVHDRFVVDGGDGRRYRVWHPQADPSGCIYGHEHGDDPAIQTNAWVRQNFDGRMGYSAVRFGMDEPHNGYKVHVANIGEMNDEGRVNRNATTSMPHVGTGGPARFTVNHHSVSIADWHENGIHHTVVNTRFDTGTRANPVEVQCPANPSGARTPAPTKDAIVLGQPCKVNSSYEIWSMVAKILYADGRDLLHKFVVPAMFDPITVFNPNNPAERVFAWDPRVAAHKNFPNDWSGFRGCAREGYSQVGYHFNGSDPSEEYLLDTRTNRVVAAANAWTTRLVVGRSNSAGAPPFSSNILQYKKRRDHCDHRAQLSLTN